MLACTTCRETDKNNCQKQAGTKNEDLIGLLDPLPIIVVRVISTWLNLITC